MSLLNRLFGKKSASRRNSGSRWKKLGGRALSLERLERRELMTGVVGAAVSSNFAVRAYVEQYNNRTEQVFESLNTGASYNPVGPVYDNISQLTFSPDTTKLAFVAETVTSSGKSFAVIENGAQVGPSANTAISQLQFSANSQHLAFVAENTSTLKNVTTDAYTVIEDGKAIATATVVENSTPNTTIINPGISDLCFNPNSQYLAFIENNVVVSSNGTSTLSDQVVDNGSVVGTANGLIESLTFSPDGRHTAYVKPNGTSYLLIEDGKTVATASNWIFNVTFSPNSRHFAYVESNTGRGCTLFEDGNAVASGAFTYNSLTFSPDSSHLAYVVDQHISGSGASANYSYATIEDGNQVGPTITTSASGPFSDLTFSPDSKHLAFVMENAGAYSVLKDGAQVGPAVNGAIADLVFSKDSKFFAYTEQLTLNGTWYLNENGQVLSSAVKYADKIVYLGFGSNDQLESYGF